MAVRDQTEPEWKATRASDLGEEKRVWLLCRVIYFYSTPSRRVFCRFDSLVFYVMIHKLKLDPMKLQIFYRKLLSRLINYWIFQLLIKLITFSSQVC